MWFSEGGNWDVGTYAGDLYFSMAASIIKREIRGWALRDMEGMSDRWIQIMEGKTNWIPKIVFKLKKAHKGEQNE